MHCDYCKSGHYPVCTRIKERLPGGVAEYVRVPAALVENGAYHLPDTIDHDQSTFIEPLACAVRAQRLAGLQENQTVMIFGCGMSGLLHVKLAKAKNCRVVATDINSRRLKMAAGLDADITINAAEIAGQGPAAAELEKAAVVMICTSAMSAVEQAWNWVDKGGRIVFFAVPGPEKAIVAPLNDFWTKEIQILTSYYCGPPDIVDAIDLIESGTVSVDDLITHRLPLNKTADGFQLVLDGKESIKVIIQPNQ
jgi:L-iditol 2-dehydrogenase